MGYTLSWLPASLWPKSGAPSSLPALGALLLHSQREGCPWPPQSLPHSSTSTETGLAAPNQHQIPATAHTAWGVPLAALVTEDKPFSVSPTPHASSIHTEKGSDFPQIIRGNKEINVKGLKPKHFKSC